jgi:hypothetical protein
MAGHTVLRLPRAVREKLADTESEAEEYCAYLVVVQQMAGEVQHHG